MPEEKKNIIIGDVWWADFPFDNTEESKIRPVVVLDVSDSDLSVLSVKVTSHDVRAEDNYDVPIVYWSEACLRIESTARVAKTITIPKNLFKKRMGRLHPDDWEAITTKYMEYLDSLEKSFKEASDKSEPLIP